jgi:hypothetical protein
MRSSRFTALELAQTLRYIPDLVVVLALLAAIAFTAPNRPSSGWLDASPARAATIISLTALFLASSLHSTSTFLTSWRDNPAEPYLMNARVSLAAADATAPLLDQEVDPLVLQRVTWPENLASHMFALLRDRPDFAQTTTQLRMLTSKGLLSLSDGPEVKVPVHPGLNRVYARLPGAGDAIMVRATTTALALCLASGPVGFLAPR